MNTTTLHPIDDFARAVRAALSDLPPDEVEDLTDGLEADLAERAADEESPDFGDPAAYASELRSAAGLPPRASQRSRRIDGVLAATWREFIGGLRELHTHPLIARLAAFLVALRPLWWVFRAWVFYGIVTWAFGVPALGFNLATFVIGVGSLIVSVQLGRGKWQPRAWMRATLLVVNIVLVLTVPVALIATSSAFGSQVNNAFADGLSQSTQGSSGLESNGHQITNIFAYDAAGKPLTNVQLFDQAGQPLNTVPDTSMKVTDVPFLVPNKNVVGRRGWNVYPLETVTYGQLDADGNPKASAKPKPATPTYLIVAPLANANTATSTSTPTPSPIPTN
jgi:hypothetical protein